MPVITSLINAFERSLGSGRLLRNIPLAAHTTFKIGGPADFFFEAKNAEELIFAIRTAREYDTHFFLLGMGAFRQLFVLLR